MAINVSARKFKLMVGDEDYSAAMVEAKLDTTELNQSGFVTTTGSITLADVRDLPGSLDDRKNPITWRVGQKIEIYVTDSSGILKIHPAGCLRTISSEWDYETRRLTIRVGCILTLLSFKQPTEPLEGQDPEVITSPNNSRLDIVTRLLNQAGLTNINCPYNIGYPITYPVEPTGSYIETAGKILYSAGFVGWIDRYEVLQIKPVTLTGNAALTITLGNDDGLELWYRRLTSNEGPRETIKVVGNKKLAQRIISPQTTNITRYGSALTVDPTASDNQIVVEQTQIIETFGGNTQTTTTNTNKPIGLVLPNLTSGRFNLSLVERKIETKQYESGKKGKLLSATTQVYRVFGQILAEYVKSLEENGETVQGQTLLILAEEIRVNYSYDSKERPSTITTIKSETTGALLSGINTDWSEYTGLLTTLQISESRTERWTHRQGITWKHEVSATKVLSRLHPELIRDDWELWQKLSISADDSISIVEISNSGQTVPPAPERRNQRVTWVDKRTCGKAQFSQHGGNPLRERERTYSIEYLEGGIYQEESGGSSINLNSDDCNDAQCNALASIEGALLHGRFKGQDLGIALMDELFNWQPLMRVNCIEPTALTKDNMTTRAFCLDDSHWYLGQEKALCNFGCIYCGDVTTKTTTNIIIREQSVVGSKVIFTLPITTYIPLGTKLNFNGMEVVTTVSASFGDTEIFVSAIPNTILNDASAQAVVETLNLPYVPTSRLIATFIIGGRAKYYPYSLSPDPLVVRGGVGIGGISSKASFIRGGMIIGGGILGTPVSNVIGGLLIGGWAESYFSQRSFYGGLLIGGSFSQYTTSDEIEILLFGLEGGSTEEFSAIPKGIECG